MPSKRLTSLIALVVAFGIALATVVAGAALSGRRAGESYDATARGATKLQVYPGRYIVQLADAPLAAYRGGLPGLAATSPAATGGGKLNAESASARAYRSYLQSRQAATLASIRSLTGRKVTPLYTFDAAFNGMVLELNASEVARVAALPGVVRVEPDYLAEPDTDRGPNIIGAVQADQKPALFKATLSGANEVPANDSTATGEAVAVYDATSKTISYRIEISGLSGPPAGPGAHIHIAPAGANGPIVVDILDTAVITGPQTVFIGSKVLTDTFAGGITQTVAIQEAALYAEGLYFNIHTAAYLPGEVRGQIKPNMGEGMIVGIIDSGINATHASFADIGGDGYDHTNPLGAGVYKGVCDPANEYARTPAEFPCNDKLIGAYTWLATNDSPNTAVTPNQPSPNDDDGHGSHTASTAAGNVVANVAIQGLPFGQVSGVAPHANVIAYDVCGFIDDGGYNPACPTSASLASINQAVLDGVDVLNFSISGSANPWASSVDLAFLNAFNGGVLSSASAGNSGPTAATVAHNGPWQMNVGATTIDRSYTNGLDNLSGGATTPPANINGLGGSGASPLVAIIYAGVLTDTSGALNPLCRPFSAPSATALAGKMVVCDRGVLGRVEKAENVQAAGGAAYVLANTSATQSINGDIYPIPGVHISSADATTLKTWLSTGNGHQGQIRGGTKVLDPDLADFIASFSSRGPSAVAGLLAPDIAAPGQDTAAAVLDKGSGDEFNLLSGTSMASPHNAGALALLRQLHPDWTLAELMSALMTTADDIGYTPFSQGAGRVNVSKAALAGLVLNETGANMLAADPDEGGDPRTLNVASFADGACVTNCSWSRTVRSTLAVTSSWQAAVSASPGLTVTVEPATITLGPGASGSFTVTADVNGLPFNQYAFASIVMTEENSLAPDAAFPLAVQPVAAILPAALNLEGGPNGNAVSDEIIAIAISDLQVEISGLTKADVDQFSLTQDSDNGSIYDDLEDGVFVKSVDVTSDTVRFVAKIAASSSNDIDLFVHLDANEDGVPGEDEQVCTSATGAVLEECDFVPAEFGTYIIVVQNWEASEAVTDTVTLETAAVGGDAGNLSVNGPLSVTAKTPFTITLDWDVSGGGIGAVYYGMLRLGSSPGGPNLAAVGDLGSIPLRLTVDRSELFLPIMRLPAE